MKPLAELAPFDSKLYKAGITGAWRTAVGGFQIQLEESLKDAENASNKLRMDVAD